MSRKQGFTLLELIITVAVASISLTAGLPSFVAATRQNCAVSGASSLMTMLTLARSEAVKRGKTVSICKSSDGGACTRDHAVDWSHGTVMFEDDNSSGTLDANEKTIAADSSPTSCGVITTNKFVNYISFDGEGVANVNGSFFMTATAAPDVNRTVSIFQGRVRICDPRTDSTCPAAQ